MIKYLWNWLWDPTTPLKRKQGQLLLEARNLQRQGDIPGYAKKIREASDITKQIEELTKNKTN